MWSGKLHPEILTLSSFMISCNMTTPELYMSLCLLPGLPFKISGSV
uniref:Uncharacterized protein n=1 Tax=Rhizophora mucronata TaxID=61149 RepID=A0A2P2J275_RHIMU